MSSKLWTAVTCLFAACASVDLDQIIPIEEYQAPQSVPAPPYQLQPGDILEIRYLHNSDLNVTLPIPPDGTISLPRAHGLQAAGKTVAELEEELLTRTTEFTNPEVVVILQKYSSHQAHIGGEVRRPGVIDLHGRMTVLQAIFEAGGLLDTAHLNQVLLIRRNPDLTHQVLLVDLEGVIEGSQPRQNVELLPYDAVFIPKTRIANFDVFVDQYIRKAIPITFSYKIETTRN